jgi:death-on-curing protein
MTEWKWVDPKIVQAVHEHQLAEHGGLEGVRDAGLIESALARPKNLAAYGEPDAADLAKNHGFADGNKRTAWIAARLFLADNGYALQANGIEAVQMVTALAAGTMDETEVAGWFRARIR